MSGDSGWVKLLFGGIGVAVFTFAANHAWERVSHRSVGPDYVHVAVRSEKGSLLFYVRNESHEPLDLVSADFRIALPAPEQALFGGTGLVAARTVLELAATVLDARIAWARGSRDQSIQLWTKAVAAADRLPYDEPPVWFYPLRESLGAALLQSDKAAQAEKVFRDDLVRHPRNARSLFGLRESLIKQGKDADAAWVQRDFEEAWKNADTKLTIESL